MGEDTLHPFEAAERQKGRILTILRMTLLVMLVTVSLLVVLQDSGPSVGTITAIVPVWAPPVIAVVLFLVVMGIDRYTPNKKIATISGVFLGLVIGLVATVALSLVMRLILRAWMDAAAYRNFEPFLDVMEVLVGISICYLAIATVIQTQDDFRLVIPYVEFSKQLRGPKPLILDSSTLIDARVIDVAATGILQVPLVIPRFVIAELQLLADQSDKLKRARGRRGLDVITRLQRMARLDVSVDDTPVPGKAVDTMLIELAHMIAGTVMTTDTGLARVAQIEGVSVLSVNDLANSLKPALIPGEQLSIHLVKRGEQGGQGVGYLDDGTMVVIEGGESSIGQTVEAEVTTSIQTSGGRMIFAKLTGSDAPDLDDTAPLFDAPAPEREQDAPGAGGSAGPSGPRRKSQVNRARNPRR